MTIQPEWWLAERVGRRLCQGTRLVRIVSEIEAPPPRYFSAISRWEAVAALCKSHGLSVDEATAMVDDLFKTFAFQIVPIGNREGELAGSA